MPRMTGEDFRGRRTHADRHDPPRERRPGGAVRESARASRAGAGRRSAIARDRTLRGLRHVYLLVAGKLGAGIGAGGAFCTAPLEFSPVPIWLRFVPCEMMVPPQQLVVGQ